MTKKGFPAGKAAYAALFCLMGVGVFAVCGCNKDASDAANANGGTVPHTTGPVVVPSSAPPAAQQSIQSAQAQGAGVQQRINSQDAALKAAAQGRK